MYICIYKLLAEAGHNATHYRELKTSGLCDWENSLGTQNLMQETNSEKCECHILKQFNLVNLLF